MSSPANGPYQSRLFNFLNRQNHRIKEQYHRAARQVKVAAVWGVQIALYPLYLLVQMGRATGNQFQQAVKRQQLNAATPSETEAPPPADTPIQGVFQALQQEDVKLSTSVAQELLQSADKGEIDSTQPAALPICGVASLLTTRSIVLVTTENQILDILTPQQQQKLVQRIAWELADYWHRWRLAKLPQKQSSYYLPIVPQKDRRVLAPVRVFWRIMVWMQTSPVAIATNLFQESSLVFIPESQFNLVVRDRTSTAPTAPPQVALTPHPLVQSLTVIDRTVAELETQQLQIVSSLSNSLIQRTQGVLQRRQNKQDLSLSQPSFANAPTAAKTSQSYTVKIHLLIEAAVDYFFGKHKGQWSLNHPSKHQTASNAFTGTFNQPIPQLSGDATLEEDPWLTWADLFPPTSLDEDSATVAPRKSHNIPALPTQPDTPVGNSFLGAVKRFLKFQKADLQTIPQPTTSELVTSESISASKSQIQTTPTRKREVYQVVPKKAPPRNLSQPVKKNLKPVSESVPHSSPLEFTPDWIETEATPAGYVKHPLEQLLEWLDLLMLWIEGRLIKIWQWVRRGFR